MDYRINVVISTVGHFAIYYKPALINSEEEISCYEAGFFPVKQKLLEQIKNLKTNGHNVEVYINGDNVRAIKSRTSLEEEVRKLLS